MPFESKWISWNSTQEFTCENTVPEIWKKKKIYIYIYIYKTGNWPQKICISWNATVHMCQAVVGGNNLVRLRTQWRGEGGEKEGTRVEDREEGQGVEKGEDPSHTYTYNRCVCVCVCVCVFTYYTLVTVCSLWLHGDTTFSFFQGWLLKANSATQKLLLTEAAIEGRWVI